MRSTCLAILLLAVPVAASAQQNAAPEPDEAASADTGPRSSEPPLITLDEEFVIEGRVRKPEAFFFLRRTPFGYIIRTLDENFLEQIVRAAAGDPF